jgi:hypothetical protein
VDDKIHFAIQGCPQGALEVGEEIMSSPAALNAWPEGKVEAEVCICYEEGADAIRYHA